MSECIEWPTGTNTTGYCQMRVGDGRLMLVHRLVWMQDNGHTDLEICHTCDNRRCVNIDHLYAGTHKQNMQDMKQRGRVRGTAQANSKKTACPQGHPYDRVYGGRRYCSKCMKQRDAVRKGYAA